MMSGMIEEVPRGVERLARAEQLAGQRRLQPGLGGAGGVVDQQHGVVDLARGVGLRRAERDVMLPQFGQHLAAGEAEVLDDEVALAEVGPSSVSVMQRGISERMPLSSKHAGPGDRGIDRPTRLRRHRHGDHAADCPRLPVSRLRPLPQPPVRRPTMKENFRQFLDRLRQAGELVDLHQAVDIRHIATLVDQAKTALFFHNVIGYDMPVVSGIIRSKERATMAMGCETFGEIEHKLAQAIAKPIPPRHVNGSPTREVTLRRRRRRSLQAADPDVVDLRRRADDHRRRGDRPRPGARHEQRHLPLHRQGKGAHRHRHRHAEQHAAVRAARLRAEGAAADLDLDRHASVRDHRLGLSRAARRRRDGDRRRPARRGGRACALLDHRHALHRRRRDRAGGGNPADRLDLAGGPLRRVHPADGRPALEPAGAHQGDLDAQGRDLLQPAHAVGEHLARGADALRRDPAGAARPPTSRSRTSTSRSAAARSGTR